MKKLSMFVSSTLMALFLFIGFANAAVLDLKVGSEKSVTTAPVTGLPTSFGGADAYYSIFRMYGLKAGQRYEATLTYEAGTDIGYSHAWVDGNPFGKDFFSFVGIGTGTGTRKIAGKQDKFVFTVAQGSASDSLYIVLRSNKPWPIRFAVSSPTGVNRESRDRWGYYYVTDFDADKNAPFLLKR